MPTRHDEARSPFARLRVLARDATAAWHAVGALFRTLLARFFSSIISKKAKAEFSVPGELRMVILFGRIRDLALLIMSVIIVISLMVVIGSFVSTKSTDEVKPVLTVLVVIFVVTCTGFFFLVVWLGWYRRFHYRVPSTTFAPFGHVAHLVPQV